MAMYSHSKLSTFEQCPLKFKYKYLDKIPPPVKATIEAHLGSSVHAALEWLYKEVKKGKLPILDEVIVYYANYWQDNFDEDINIIQEDLNEKDFFNKGVKFLIDYYTRNSPFDDNTLELEKRITLKVDSEGNYKLIGFIDRLVYNLETGEYEVHDYKTANSMPPKEKFDLDRQLALYSIAIKDEFGEDKKVCLVWHYLAHGQKVCSYRTDEQLRNLKKETLELIKKIESTKNFPSNVTKLCDWCEYKSICPEWNKDFNSDTEIKDISENEKIESGNKTIQENSVTSMIRSKSELDNFPTIKKYVRD